MFISTICSIGFFLLKILPTFLTYISLSIFFSLNLSFLTNSELTTRPIASSYYLKILLLWFLLIWFLLLLSGTVHTRVEVCGMDSEMSGLVEQPWLQLMCCTVCLPHSRNFRWWEEVWDGSECWLVCRHWTLEIEFNKSYLCWLSD